MKKYLSWRFLIFSIFILLLSGCSGPKGPKKHGELEKKNTHQIIARVIDVKPAEKLIVIDRGKNDYFNKIEKKVKVLKNLEGEKNSVNIDWHGIAATGNIFKVYTSTSTIRLETVLSEPNVNDIITAEIDIEPPSFDSPLFSLWLNDINFQDISREKKFISTDIVFSDNHEQEYKTMISAMIADLHSTAIEFEEMVTSNFVEGGKFDGMSYKEAIFSTTETDIENFLNFVKYYPGKYISQTWNLNDVYMTWVISETPDAKEDILREKAAPYLKTAREHLAKSETDQSEEAIKEAMKVFPNSQDAKDLMQKIQEFNDLKKLSQENPENLNIIFRLGELYYDFGDYDNAVSQFKILTEKDFKKGIVLFRIGKCYFQKEEYDLAVDNFRQAKSADPSLDYLDKWIRISESYKKIKSDIKYKSESYFAIAKIFFDDEVFDSSSYYYNLGLEIDPTNLEAITTIQKIKKITDAYQNLDWAREMLTQDLDLERGMNYITKALEIMREVNYEKGIIKVLDEAGDMFEDLGNMYLAIEFYQQLVNEFPDTPEGYIGMSSSYTLLLDFENSIKEADKGLAKFPENVTLNNMKGFALRRLSRFEEAIPYLQKAKENDKTFYAPVESLFFCYVNQKRYDDAQNILDYLKENFKDESSPNIYGASLEKILELKDKQGRTNEDNIHLLMAYYHIDAYSEVIKIGNTIKFNNNEKEFEYIKNEVIGKSYYFILDFKNAIEYFKKAQRLFPSSNLNNFEKYTDALLSVNDNEKAHRYFIDSELAEGNYFNAYTFTLYLPESKEKEQLVSRIKTGLDGERFYKQGERFLNLYKFDDAFEYFRKAEKIFTDINDNYSLINTLLQLFYLKLRKSEIEEARNYLGKIDYIYAKYPNPDQERMVRNARMKLYLNYGKFNLALEEQNKLLRMDEYFFNLYDLNLTYSEIANIYYSSGDNTNAVKYFDLTIKFSELHNNYNLITMTCKNLTWIYARKGEFEKAKEYLDKAFTYFKKGIYNADLEMNLLNTKADLYSNLGDMETATEAFNEIYSIASMIGDDTWRGIAKNNLGEMQAFYMNDLENGEKNLKEAIELFEKTNFRIAYSIATSNLAELEVHKGNLEHALELSSESLKIAEELNVKDSITSNHLTLSKIYLEKKEFEKSIESATKTINLSSEIGIKRTLWKALLVRGKAYEGKGDNENAVKDYKESIKVLNDIFMSYSSPEFQEKFFKFENKQEPYTRLIELLIKLGRKEEALKYLEEQKSFMSKETFQNFDQIGKDNPELNNFLKEIKEKQQKNENLKELLAQEKEKPKEFQDKEKIKYLTEVIAKTEGEFNKLMLQLEFKYPDVYSLLSIKPVNIADIRDKLPKNTVILEYFITDENMYIFIISGDGFKAQTVDVNNEALEEKVINFKRLIMDTENRDELFQNLSDLYDILIRPVENDIEKYEILSVIPFGILYYIPYSALIKEIKNGEPVYLLDIKKVDYLTSATLLDIVNEKKVKGNYSLIGFGNPENNLPYSESEVVEIRDTIFKNAKIYIKSEATKEKFFNEAQNYNIVHLATHGILKYKPLD
ncbi:MAG: tetratricopeptide repeat protein, partial [bacterium]|nr:tetratricopeptide repeat protein [bacterium]